MPKYWQILSERDPESRVSRVLFNRLMVSFLTKRLRLVDGEDPVVSEILQSVLIVHRKDVLDDVIAQAPVNLN